MHNFSFIFHFQAYFCGQAPHCILHGSSSALSAAKANVESLYPVVGVLEDLKASFSAIEAALPLFFAGVRRTYERQNGDFLSIDRTIGMRDFSCGQDQ